MSKSKKGFMIGVSHWDMRFKDGPKVYYCHNLLDAIFAYIKIYFKNRKSENTVIILRNRIC